MKYYVKEAPKYDGRPCAEYRITQKTDRGLGADDDYAAIVLLYRYRWGGYSARYYRVTEAGNLRSLGEVRFQDRPSQKMLLLQFRRMLKRRNWWDRRR